MTGILKKKKLIGEFLGYLDNLEAQFSSLPILNKYKDLECLDGVLEALRVRSAYFIYTQMLKAYSADKDRGVPTKELLNDIYQQDQILMINYHLAYYTVWSAKMHIEQKCKIQCPNLKRHIENLICIFGLNDLMNDSSLLFDCGYFSKSGLNRDHIMSTLKSKIASIRPQFINLIEGVDFPDTTLNSSIGNFYGDIYE